MCFFSEQISHRIYFDIFRTVKFNFLSTENSEKKIIIVGAGIAGLFCARQLLTHGFQNVLILEASNRVGGRISPCSVVLKTEEDTIKDVLLDTGPQRVSRGTNSMFEFASCYGLLDKSAPDYCEALKNLSTVYTSGEENVIADLAFYFSQFYYFPKCSEEILESKDFQEKFKKYDQSLIQKYARGVYDWHRSFVYEYSFLPADMKNGYAEMLKMILKNIPVKWIMLNKEVIKIDWTELMPELAKASSDDEPSQIEVWCRKQIIGHYIADHVIITVPLGYLKQNAGTLFTPPLSESKMNAIQSLDFITFDKIYFIYEEPFWKIPDVFHVIWNETLEKLFCEDHDDRQGQTAWVRYITHFEYVPSSPLILLACVWHEGAKIAENLTVERLILDCKKLLMHLLQKEIPEARSVVRSTWHSDPLYRGSLPYDPSRNAGADISKIAESIYGGPSGTTPVVLFAGDATNKMDLACVHGAAASGIRAANVLYDHYKDEKILK